MKGSEVAISCHMSCGVSFSDLGPWSLGTILYNIVSALSGESPGIGSSQKVYFHARVVIIVMIKFFEHLIGTHCDSSYRLHG